MKIVFVVERDILHFGRVKFARSTSQESMTWNLNNLLDNESGNYELA